MKTNLMLISILKKEKVMKRIKTTLIGILTFVSLTFTSSMAAEMKGAEVEKMDHSKHQMDTGTTDHPMRAGDNIHNATVDGFTLAYHLIDMGGNVSSMQSEGPAKKETHHLMLYVNDPNGKPVGSAKVGFMIETSTGSHQKVMSMPMGVGGYGANIDLSTAGTYKLMSKIIIGDKTIKNDFSYTVK
jgi:hypothetical protein